MNTPLPPPPQMPFMETPTNEKARLSLILGIGSLLAGRFLPVLFNLIPMALTLLLTLLVAAAGVAGIVLGAMAWSEIKKSLMQQGGKWLAIGGMVSGLLGVLSLLQLMIIVVLALLGPYIGGVFSNVVEAI